jgi:CIC family chloride channel protein
MVQMAAAIASLLGRWLRVSPAQLRLLVACGAAAGIASAYNAPIAGALFVAEIVLGSIAMECFGPLVLASVMASLVMRTLHGSSPLYELSQFRFEGTADLLAYAVLGALCGAVVPVFHWTLQAGRQIFSRFKLPLPLKLAVGGVVVGLLAISHPEVTGNGATVIHALIGNELAWDAIATLLVYKLLATSATFGSGAVGGVFTPALLMGACIGSLFAMALGHLDRWEAIPPASCAVIGMAAFLAGATRAPLMSILMIFEMTLNSSVLVPVMTASVLGYYVARSLGGGSLYNEQLREAAAGLFGRPVTSITVGQLMRKPEPALSPESEFREIARRFVVPHAEWVPVSGIEGQFLGIVLRDDVENNLSDTDLQGIVIAGDLLRPAPVQLSPRTTLLDAIKMVTHATVEDAPVVGSDGKLIGVLGKNDLLIALSQTGQRSTAEAKPAE